MQWPGRMENVALLLVLLIGCDCLSVCLFVCLSVGLQVTKDGVSISEPFALDVKWDYKMFSAPTKWAVGAW